jgi:hypothetical protein
MLVFRAHLRYLAVEFVSYDKTLQCSLRQQRFLSHDESYINIKKGYDLDDMG